MLEFEERRGTSDGARVKLQFRLVDTEKVKAEYKNGVLAVTLGKKEIAKPKTIKVEAVSN